MLAARALGMPEWQVLVRHLLPGALPVVLVSTSLQVGSAILVEASLGFLGLSDPTVVSWGGMLSSAQAVARLAWWTAVWPGLAITVLVLATSLAADGLAAVLDPRRLTRTVG